MKTTARGMCLVYCLPPKEKSDDDSSIPAYVWLHSKKFLRSKWQGIRGGEVVAGSRNQATCTVGSRHLRSVLIEFLIEDWVALLQERLYALLCIRRTAIVGHRLFLRVQ